MISIRFSFIEHEALLKALEGYRTANEHDRGYVEALKTKARPDATIELTNGEASILCCLVALFLKHDGHQVRRMERDALRQIYARLAPLEQKTFAAITHH